MQSRLSAIRTKQTAALSTDFSKTYSFYSLRKRLARTTIFVLRTTQVIFESYMTDTNIIRTDFTASNALEQWFQTFLHPRPGKSCIIFLVYAKTARENIPCRKSKSIFSSYIPK